MKKVSDVKKLPDCVKRFVVKCFAGFDEPDRIRVLVEEFYDLSLIPEQLLQMNPEQYQLFVLEEKWDHFFNEERQKVLDAPLHVPVAHKCLRIRFLQALYDMFKERGDIEMTLKVLEQARKETGPLYREMVRAYKELNQDYKPPVFKA